MRKHQKIIRLNSPELMLEMRMLTREPAPTLQALPGEEESSPLDESFSLSPTIATSSNDDCAQQQQLQQVEEEDEKKKRSSGSISSNRKCVKFAGTREGGPADSSSFVTDIIQIEHHHDLTKAEASERWYTKEDFVHIKSHLKLSIKLKAKYGDYGCLRVNSKGLEVCSRGIETPSETRMRKDNQKIASQAVINEQFLQNVEGKEILPELIAMMYSIFSFPCQQQAYQNAIQDAVDVGYTDDDDDNNDQKKDVDLDAAGAEMKMDSGVLQRFNAAGGGSSSASDIDESNVEDWLVKRFDKAERLVNLSKKARSHLLANKEHTIDVE